MRLHKVVLHDGEYKVGSAYLMVDSPSAEIVLNINRNNFNAVVMTSKWNGVITRDVYHGPVEEYQSKVASISLINRDGDGFRVTHTQNTITIEKADCKGQGNSPLWQMVNGDYPNADKMEFECNPKIYDGTMKVTLSKGNKTRELTITRVNKQMSGGKLIGSYKTEMMKETPSRLYHDTREFEYNSDVAKELDIYFSLRDFNYRREISYEKE